MRNFLSSGWRRYALPSVVVAASLGVMGAQCQPTKPPPPPPSDLSISPTAWDFGDNRINNPNFEGTSFRVTNNGPETTGPLAFSVQGGDADQFLHIPSGLNPGVCVPNSPITLAPGQSCLAFAGFRPTRTGPLSTTFVVTADPGGTATAALTGNGILPPAGGQSISPASWDFGDQKTDGSGQVGPAQLIVTNHEFLNPTGPLAVSVQGGDADQFILFGGNCNGNVLGPGNSCEERVFFNPTRTGPLSASLVITGNPGGTVTAALTGNGVPAP
jgi:hypothetical protein